jgi:hypothetical protein
MFSLMGTKECVGKWTDKSDNGRSKTIGRMDAPLYGPLPRTEPDQEG